MEIDKAVHGFKQVIVPDCPYCHEEHTHSSDAEGVIIADCLQGDYILDFENSITAMIALMDEIEMRYGVNEDRWGILRGLLEK